MDNDVKKHLDTLSDEELLFECRLRFGQFVPVWEDCSKEEYEENCLAEDEPITVDNLCKWLYSCNVYKKRPRWKNVQSGILWQIEHYNDKPDYYDYYKLVREDFVLMLGSEMIDYLRNRKPKWYQ